MESAVAGLQGVKGAKADFASKSLAIQTGPGFDPMAAIKALEKAGFGATPN